MMALTLSIGLIISPLCQENVLFGVMIVINIIIIIL